MATPALRSLPFLRQHPSAFLLAVQMVSLFCYAAFEGHGGSQALLGAIGALTLAMVVWVIIRSPALNVIGWGLASMSALLAALSWGMGKPALLVWAAVPEGLLHLYGAGAMVAYMMADDKVTRDELFAAGATFTLMAWGFAQFFWICEFLHPGSFVMGSSGGPVRTFLELLYLSFTNLSSTGLSDISPATALARVLIMVEQFIGFAYLTMVVSRLIAMTVRGRR